MTNLDTLLGHGADQVWPLSVTDVSKWPTGGERNVDDEWSDAVVEVWLAILDPHPEEDLHKAQEDLAATLLTEERRAVEREQAAARLGLPLDASRQAIFARVDSLIARHPERADDYWCAAYDLLPALVSGPESARAAVEECSLRLAALREALVELCWPSHWDARIAPVWKRYGGTADSAAAWAHAGWLPERVFDTTAIAGLEVDDPQGRLQAIDVPPY